MFDKPVTLPLMTGRELFGLTAAVVVSTTQRSASRVCDLKTRME